MEEYLNQYGTNEYKDLSHITISIDDFPPAMLVSEPGFEPNSVFEHDTDSASRFPLPSKDLNLIFIFRYFSLTCLISDKLYISLVGDMGRLTDAAARKPKNRSKKTTCGEKRKLDTKCRSPTPKHISDPEHEHDASPLEPEIKKMPKKPKAPKKKDASKETDVVIREPVLEAKEATLAPAGDKGKEKLHVPSPLAKRQKVTLPTEPRQASSVPEELARHVIDLNHRL